MLSYVHAKPAAAALLFGEGLAVTAKDLVLPNDAAQAAEQLYAALHALDSTQAEIILIESPPATPAWEALRDRLQRAAYHPHDQNN
jgi:L-threonylcarbamoyladenylate synthase